MLTSVFAKTVRDRWRGMGIAVIALGLGLLMAMSVYRNFDASTFSQLPEAWRSLMSIPQNADTAAVAIGVLYGLYGAFTLAGLSIAMGAASIAGEERDGTIGLLLGNPKSRSGVLAGKTANMVALVTAGTVALLALAYLVAGVLGVDLGDMHVAAYSAHIWVNTVFYGMIAFAAGAWTGSRGLAIGLPTGIMVLGFLLTGIFPLIGGWENVAKAMPWYYFDGSDPINHGFSPGHFAVLLVSSIVLGVIAYVGVNRRDLKGQTTGTSIIDRLRGNPLTKNVADRIAGSIRVSRISVKTFSDHQGLFIVDAYVMFLIMGVMMGPLYALMDNLLLQYADQLPEALWAFVGSSAGGGMSTPEGFYEAETFGMMAWIAVMVMTVIIGSRALAGEEADRTMGLLLANPIPRSKVIVEKVYAMVGYAFAVGLATWAGVWIGSLLGGLGISPLNIAATTAMAVLVGLDFGAASLFLSAATGRVRVAVFGTIGIALAMFLINSIAILNKTVDVVAVFTPFGHYLTNSPLRNGMDWGNAAVLTAAFLVLVSLSVYTFNRRDLRQGA
jgi:ABC-2 type transport system permease protein